MTNRNRPKNYETILAPAIIPAASRALAAGWLMLGVGALAIAGIFAILLVLGRSPVLSSLFPVVDLFRTSLIVHVDESVLIWFLAFGGVLWSLAEVTVTPLSRGALALAATGCITIALSPFVAAGEPYLDNYVPVLHNNVFFAGLVLFGSGVFLQAVWTARQPFLNIIDWREPFRLAALTASWAVLLAILVTLWTGYRLPPWPGQIYFDLLFWGGGHTLQFAYTQIMLAAWLGLAAALKLKIPAPVWLLQGFLLLGVLPLVVVPILYAVYGVDSYQLHIGFTLLMQIGGGLAALPVGLLLIYGLIKRRLSYKAPELPLLGALLSSLLVFAAGGIIAMMIKGTNTIIPAHYHGSIVGITLALMGFSYYLLPRLGFGEPPALLASIQPWIYAFGQLLHIGGLAASGELGVQRKTAGMAQGLEALHAKIAMGVMGIGGLLAIIGGILFVIAVIMALRATGEKVNEYKN